MGRNGPTLADIRFALILNIRDVAELSVRPTELARSEAERAAQWSQLLCNHLRSVDPRRLEQPAGADAVILKR